MNKSREEMEREMKERIRLHEAFQFLVKKREKTRSLYFFFL
jgi:hypothetical protein